MGRPLKRKTGVLRPGHRELPTLTSGVEALLKRLIHLVAGHMSLARLVQLVELVYVEEVEDALGRDSLERGGMKQQLGLVTGLDEAAIRRIQANPAYRTDRSKDVYFMGASTPTTELLDRWSSDPQYRSPATGQPLEINILGSRPSIEHLISETHFPEGISPRAVAERLVASGAAIFVGQSSRLHLQTGKFMPDADRDLEGAIEMGFNAIGRLMGTVATNIGEQRSRSERFYQRCYWSNRLPRWREQELRQRMSGILREMEQSGTALLEECEQPVETADQITGGFGLYYFEDERPAADND